MAGICLSDSASQDDVKGQGKVRFIRYFGPELLLIVILGTAQPLALGELCAAYAVALKHLWIAPLKKSWI
jgi:hypothetical protein